MELMTGIGIAGINVKASYDACITVGNFSFMLEFASIKDCNFNEIYMQLLKLEHELSDPDNLGETAALDGFESRMNTNGGIGKGYNYFFMLPGVYDTDLVVGEVARYLESRGMKVRIKDGKKFLEDVEADHIFPQDPLFVVQKE